MLPPLEIVYIMICLKITCFFFYVLKGYMVLVKSHLQSFCKNKYINYINIHTLPFVPEWWQICDKLGTSFLSSALLSDSIVLDGGISYFPLSVQTLRAWTSYQESSFSHVVEFSVNLRSVHSGWVCEHLWGFHSRSLCVFILLSVLWTWILNENTEPQKQNPSHRLMPHSTVCDCVDDNRMELFYKVCFIKPKDLFFSWSDWCLDAFLQSISSLFCVLQKEMTLPQKSDHQSAALIVVLLCRLHKGTLDLT